jgi:dihydrodipicolinate synthase/N-acetylneuraminate lyase
MKPIPASDASTLAYLAEFPDVEPEDRERLLAPLSEEAREIAKVLLGDDSTATPEVKEKAAKLKEWGTNESGLR